MLSENIFSLDIQDDLITGVLLKTSSKETVVVGCGAAIVTPGSMESGIEEVMEQAGFTDETCRVSFAAHHFFFRQLCLPFSDQRKVDKILPFELEETAPLQIENLVIDGIASDAAGDDSVVIAGMVDRNFLAEKLAQLQSLGVDPEIITISGLQTAMKMASFVREKEDFLLLDIGLQRCTVFIVKDDTLSLVRSIPFDAKELTGYTFDNVLAPPSPQKSKTVARTFGDLSAAVKSTCFMAQLGNLSLPIFLSGSVGRTVEATQYLGEYLNGDVQRCELHSLPSLAIVDEIKERWVPGSMDAALSLGMRARKTQKGFNFRKEEFSKKSSLREYRHLISKAVIPLAVSVILAISFLGYDTGAKKRERAELQQKIHGVFKETLPGVTRIVDPVKQLELRIVEQRRRTNSEKSGTGALSVLDVLAEISKRIPPAYQVKMTRLVVEKNDLRIKGNTDNFNTVDNIKKVLEKSPYFETVTISSANLAPRGGEIRFELKLQLGGA